jgi:lipocalin
MGYALYRKERAHAFFVTLSREDMQTLSELAHAASRQPRDEAIWLLSRTVRDEQARQARRRQRQAMASTEVRHVPVSA